MKKTVFLFLLLMSYFISDARGIGDTIVRLNRRPVRDHARDEWVTPETKFHSSSSTLTIDFGDSSLDFYTVTISSPYTDVDYYATSSFTTIPIIVDGISDYSIVIETADGDVFEGVLMASDYMSVD